MQGKPAIRAVMPAFRELLRYGLITTAAVLACPGRMHFDNLGTGAFSLVLESCDEASPGNVTDRTAQPVVPHHPPDVEAFHRDKAVAAD